MCRFPHLPAWSHACLTALAAFCLKTSPCFAQSFATPTSSAYSPITLSVHVEDRGARPVAKVHLHFQVNLDGQATTGSGDTIPDTRQITAEAITNADGVAILQVAPPELGVSPKSHWFRGSVHARVTPIEDPEIGFSPLSDVPLRLEETLPTAAPSALAAGTIRVFDQPDRIVDGFPIWTARSGRPDRILVILEGFDLYNRISATDNLRLIAPAADALREHGVSLLVVNYPDSHVAPDKLAPLAARAVQTAAKLSGRKVALAGFSMGGIVARWALCEAEASGTPLPVHTLLLLDSPNRGANLNPSLQAITLRYGMKADKKALSSDAAHALLTSIPGKVDWKQIGIGPMTSRVVPASVMPDTHYFDSFYGRLHTLNDNNGYPKSCRVVAIANSSRHEKEDNRSLLYLWLPYGFSWTLAAQPADHAAGSLLPPYDCDRFRIEHIFGVAGAYLRSAPTFVSCASALDASPDQTPPFAAWYARPDGLPAIPHDDIDADAGAFAVQQVLGALW